MSFQPTPFRPLASGPWGCATQFRGATGGPAWRKQVGMVVYRSLGNQIIHKVSGFTRDSTGAVLPGCNVDLFSATTDQCVSSSVSDGSGAYTLPVSGPGGPFYIVAYKAGAPDLAGTTVNTLIAV